MSKVYTMKVRRSFQTKDEEGNEITKNRWPSIGRVMSTVPLPEDAKLTISYDFAPKDTDNQVENSYVFPVKSNGDNNEI